MRRETVEDYIRAIHALEGQGMVSTSEVASFLGCTCSTVSEAFEKLSVEGYLEWKPYMGVKLNDKGRRIARRAAERFRTIYLFLLSIGVEDGQARRDAHLMEHEVSEQALSRIRMCLALEGDR
jgi:DtxR family Mn-dependent transcriptional regulator